MSEKKKERSFIGKYRVYIVSCVCIVVVMLFVLYIKKFWPFGEYSLLNGDFVLQGWPYAVSLHNKLMNGDSLYYTFEAGFGINFYSNLAFYFNPAMLLYALIPPTVILQMSTVVYLLTLLCCNISMLIYLTHRPENRLEKEDFHLMLFSLSYTLCMYVVSNTVNWNFLISAICYPLVLLGLEYYVLQGKWKLYAASLAIAFVSCYYFTGLFCVFIVLYYLTLKFESGKAFVSKSVKVLLISVLSVGISGFLTIPTYLQLMSQTYSVSNYEGNLWFVNFWNILQNFFAFNNAIQLGSTSDAYGEVSLYFGMLPLMFATMYFINPYIKWKERVRKFMVFLLYLLAFDLNPLNYAMHLMHYPSWYPNRFSWFFILYCVILAYENWVTIKENKYKKIILPAIISGVLWLGIIFFCYLEAADTLNLFVYQYSAVLVGVYLLMLLMHTISRKVIPQILVILGCVELMLSFSYSIIFRTTYVSMPVYNEGYTSMKNVIDEYCREEAHGFSKIISERDFYGQENTGVIMNYKSSTAFASSINDAGAFMVMLGIHGGSNTIRDFTYTPATLDLFNIQYIYINKIIYQQKSQFRIYSFIDDIYEDFPTVYQDDFVAIHENDDVLSVGYLINEDMNTFTDDVFQNINDYVAAVSGVSDVMKESNLKAVSMETINCQAALIGRNLMIGHDLQVDSLSNVDFSSPYNIRAMEDVEYDPTEDSYLMITYEAEQPGDYYVGMDSEICRLGYLDVGEQGQVLVHISNNELQNYIVNSGIKIAVFDNEAWDQAHQYLAENQLEVQEADSSRVKGQINCTRDGILFTSIAYDRNWHAYVDGVEVPVEAINRNGFVGISIEKGEHQVEFVYKQRGVAVGILVSVISLCMLVGLAFMSNKKKETEE